MVVPVAPDFPPLALSLLLLRFLMLLSLSLLSRYQKRLNLSFVFHVLRSGFLKRFNPFIVFDSFFIVISSV
jgi:hypothetical protein